jgi:hypothetical protein
MLKIADRIFRPLGHKIEFEPVIQVIAEILYAPLVAVSAFGIAFKIAYQMEVHIRLEENWVINLVFARISFF